jgi:hypothetical protein
VHRDPLSLAAEAIQATRCEKRDLRLVEGLAVRFHVGVAARHTVEVDLVAMTDEVREALLRHLRELDYRVGQSGGWWRAIRRAAILDEYGWTATHGAIGIDGSMVVFNPAQCNVE